MLPLASVLIALAAPVAVPPAPAARPPAARLVFRAAADVRGAVIHVGDVASVVCAESHRTTAVLAVELGPAPPAGRYRDIYPEYAISGLRRIGLSPAAVQFAGAHWTRVTRPDQIVRAAALDAAARTKAESAEADSVATIVSEPTDLHVPQGQVELRADDVRLYGSGSGVVAVQVVVGGSVEATSYVNIRLAHRVPVVVASHDLPVGTVLTESDVHMEELPEVPGAQVISDVGDAIGKQTSAAIRSGAQLAETALVAAVVIKRGSLIHLVCRGPNFVATTMGEALQDGSAGKLIRVRNLTSNLELAGLVESPDSVAVPY